MNKVTWIAFVLFIQAHLKQRIDKLGQIKEKHFPKKGNQLIIQQLIPTNWNILCSPTLNFWLKWNQMHDRWCMKEQQGSCMVGKVCFYFVHSKEIKTKKILLNSQKNLKFAPCKFFFIFTAWRLKIIWKRKSKYFHHNTICKIFQAVTKKV